MSSGDLIADRRFAYAAMLRETGDHTGAAEVVTQALEIAPDWAEGRFALADALDAAGDSTRAIAAYRAYLASDPADSMGAAVRLALLAATPPPPALPDAYVKRLFDEYAPRFDAALTERLGYRAPERLSAVLAAEGRRFACLLDLGCGTGLAGVAVRSLTDRLVGVDLSPGMIAEAHRKAIYDDLTVAEMVRYLARGSDTCDAVIAADVLVYVGDLAAVFIAVAARLSDGGVFAFTVQRGDGDGFTLGAEHRYSHSRAYVTSTAVAASFDIMQISDDVFRQEKGKDVPGLLAVLRRT